MLKPRKAVLATIIALILVVTGPASVAWASELQTLPASSLIALTTPSSGLQVSGSVLVEGTSSLPVVWLCVRGPACELDIFPIKCTGGRFSAKVYLRSGAGDYDLLASGSRSAFDGTVWVTLRNTAETYEPYLTPSAYVDSDNPAIVLLVNSIVKAGMTETQKLEAIYDWVTSNLAYDVGEYFRGAENLVPAKASDTLKDGKGTCGDFAFVVAALARAAGLQTRVVNGYTRQTGQMLHAWDEVLVDGRWVSVDAAFGCGYKSGNEFVRRPTRTYFDLTAKARTHTVLLTTLY